MWSLLLMALGGLAHAACSDSTVVLDHRLELTVSTRQELEWIQTWVVRLDAPSACSEGIPAPPGLDGAEDAGAIVAAGHLYLPPDLSPGTTVHLTRKGEAPKGTHSGLFSTAPGLRTQKAEVHLQAPQWVPLSVWTDDGANLDVVRTRSTRQARVSWASSTGQEEVAWTTWKGWDEIEASLDKSLRYRIQGADDLGPLGQEAEGLSLDQAQIQVAAAVRSTGAGSWWEVREASEILAAGQGTDAERALVLLSVLRAAGHQARPALFGPPGLSGAPGLLPAPALVPRPAVVVDTEQGRVWLDPAVPWSPSTDLPSTMRGGLAWVGGDVAHPLGTSAAPVGEVRVQTAVEVLRTGWVQVRATATLTGGGREWALAHFSPMSPEERRAEVEGWFRHTWPDLRDLDFDFQGETLTVELGLADSFRPVHDGGVGDISPLLVPVLAPRLPPNTRFLETVEVQAPEGWWCTSVASEDLPDDEGLAIRRKAWLDSEGRAHVSVDAYALTPGALDALALTARRGVPVLVFAPEPKHLQRSLKRLDTLPLSDRLVLTSLGWWQADEEQRGRKLLARAVKKVGWDEVVRQLARYARHDQRPWDAMYLMAPSDADRLQLVLAMADHGHRREAWRRAGLLSRSPDPAVRAEALVAVSRLQGWRPNAREDREAHDAWRPPVRILRAAAQTEVPGATPAGPAPVLLPLAEALLAREELQDALPVLQAASPQEGPWLQALRAEARALDDQVPVGDVLAEVQAAVDADPGNPRVLASASRAALRLHLPEHALRWSIQTALASNEVLDWLTASELALSLGDLPAALAASRRASDMIPSGSVPGISLQVLATLAGDPEQAALGTQRSGYEALPYDPLPAPWDKVDFVCGVEHRLAVLRHRDADVRASAELLAERARLHRDAGLWQELGRDGWLLARAHRQRQGWADYWTGLVGCCWSTTSSTHLDASRDKVRRMEWRLLTGAADPVSDARSLRNHARAQLVVQARYKPEDLAATLPGWHIDTPEPQQAAPAGFKASRVLSGPQGVQGWTDAERAMAIVRTGRSTGMLPPPLGAIYQLGRPLASLPGGGLLYRLEGGEAPIYAAIRGVDGQDVIGLAFTPALARTALSLAAPLPEAP